MGAHVKSVHTGGSTLKLYVVSVNWQGLAPYCLIEKLCRSLTDATVRLTTSKVTPVVVRVTVIPLAVSKIDTMATLLHALLQRQASGKLMWVQPHEPKFDLSINILSQLP